MTSETVEILIVEDNDYDAQIAIRALKTNKLDNKLQRLRDGEEAIDFFEEMKKSERIYRPKVIFLDLNMPKVDGHELVEYLKSDPLTEHIPIVIMTSSDLQADIIKSYNLGVNSYVTKPLDLPQFMNVIAEIGYYWLAINRVGE
ncbi:MAG: response regulator [Chitinophagales bacterium]